MLLPLTAQRSPSLRHDDETQASFISLLLRDCLHCRLGGQADKLVSETAFPMLASNPQFSHYYHCLGHQARSSCTLKFETKASGNHGNNYSGTWLN